MKSAFQHDSCTSLNETNSTQVLRFLYFLANKVNSNTSTIANVASTEERLPSTARQFKSRCRYGLPKDPFINYENLVCLFHGTITLLAILDRFLWNVWPRETYRIGRGSAGTDFKDGLKPGPWSVKLYYILACISGRYSILALNLVLFTMMYSLHAWLSESWLSRNVIDMCNVKAANRRLHVWNGVALAVLTLVHVWSILLPCVSHGWCA